MKKGTILSDRYKMGHKVGTGGMASVYVAEDMRLARSVAIKIIHEGLMGDETFLKQFHNEAHASSNLSHPNIVTVHDIGVHEDRYFMVMEYVEGQTLKAIIREFIAAESYIPLDRVLNFAVQICRGLGYAHRSGIVHCDVKPQNMLVSADDRLKVTDFGISRAVSEATRTNRDVVWGTPQYFSPEQAAGERPTPASDVYSIGIIMYEMLANKLPFRAENPTAIALKHLQEPPPHIRTVNPKAPPQLAQILHKVLAKEPAGRYRTAGQLERILETYASQSKEATQFTIQIPDQSKPIEKETVPLPQPRPPSRKPTSKPVRVPQPVGERQPVQHHYQDEGGINVGLIILSVLALASWIGLIPLWWAVAGQWGAF
ncbi:MAG: protein kinase [Chloroflexota bacterium]